MANNLLDLALLLQVLEAPPGEGAVDLEPVDEGGDGHETVGLDILIELVGSGLVKDDGVLGLVLDCSQSRRVSGCRGIQHVENLRSQSEAYPFPSTTSSSASSHQMPREPFWMSVLVV